MKPIAKCSVDELSVAILEIYDKQASRGIEILRNRSQMKECTRRMLSTLVVSSSPYIFYTPYVNIVPMRDIVIIGHKAKTSSDISLNDLPGSAGRMDILCRCVSSALFLSFGMRRDVNVHLLLLGEPDPGKIIRFEGLNLKYLNPDERSSGSLIQKALQKDATEKDTRSTPGVWIRRGDLRALLSEFGGRTLFYLREDGRDIREFACEIRDPVFILGDHTGVTEEEEEQLLDAGAQIVSVGPISLHSNHCITLIHNELDRAESERGEAPKEFCCRVEE